ncbi:conserved exported protein of unknown function (plasmid) [Pararobbsia alpina]|uniref:hypothetical protein n=1 Tax=Pararobbsia alpina TaxID=621374 RepID=UPI0039A55F0D
MKRTLIALSVALMCGHAFASNTDPFDFDYQIAASTANRPALVFNDGANTYVQPRAGQLVVAAGAHREGPYVVLPSVPDSFQYMVNGDTVSATWRKGNSFMGEPGNANGDLPGNFAGFSDRLILVGQRSAIDAVRPLATTTPLSGVVKALVPQGWSGSAMKNIDLTNSVTFATKDGENWMQALDRLMKQSGLYAQVDFASKHISLRDSAPKSGGMDYDAASRAPAIADPTVKTVVADAPSLSTSTQGASASASASPSTTAPTLASAFGADAIRDGDDAHIELRFVSKPGDLTVTDADGKSLKPRWDEAAHVMTFNRADRFFVSDGKTRVEVARTRNVDFVFAKDNTAGLEAVFDKDGATYLKFSDSVIHVNVFDANHIGHGEQKGRYFKFDGTPEKLTIVADGAVLDVKREPVVRFYERSGAAS